MISVTGLTEIEWIGELPPSVVGIAIGLGGVFLAAFLTRLLNKRDSPEVTPASGRTFGNGGNWEFSYRYTSEEALRAELAERKERPGRSKLVDGFFLVIGVIWILLPILAFEREVKVWQSALSVSLGLWVLYGLLLKPIFTRWRITQTLLSDDVTIRFADSGICISVNGQAFVHDWIALSSWLPTSEGIIFYWEDESPKTWLPNTAIGDIEKQKDLLLLIEEKLEYIAQAEELPGSENPDKLQGPK